MIEIIGYILFALLFILVPIGLILFLYIAVFDLIDDIKFHRKNKLNN